MIEILTEIGDALWRDVVRTVRLGTWSERCWLVAAWVIGPAMSAGMYALTRDVVISVCFGLAGAIEHGRWRSYWYERRLAAWRRNVTMTWVHWQPLHWSMPACGCDPGSFQGLAVEASNPYLVTCPGCRAWMPALCGAVDA